MLQQRSIDSIKSGQKKKKAYLSDSYGSGRSAFVEMQDEVDLSKLYTGPRKRNQNK